MAILYQVAKCIILKKINPQWSNYIQLSLVIYSQLTSRLTINALEMRIKGSCY